MSSPFFTKMISGLFLLALMVSVHPASAEEPCPITHDQINPVLTDLIFVVFDLDRDGKITQDELAVISPELASSSFGSYVGKWSEGISYFWVDRFLEGIKPLNFIDTNRNGLIEYEEVGDNVPREIFDMLDFNDNGVIDCKDVDYLTEEYTEAEGDEECGSQDILALVARGGLLYLDQDGDGLIGKEEIIILLSESGDLGSNADIFHALFNMLDTDKDGFISAVELHGTLLSIPINVINIVDTNRDGAIQYLEVPFVPLTLFAQLDTVPDGKLDCADYINQFENDEIDLPKGALGGVVRDAQTELPISGVSVKLSPGGFSDTTLPVVGTFAFLSLPYREYTLTATKEGYEPYTRTLRMDTLALTIDILLEPEVEEPEVEGEESEIEGEPVLVEGEEVIEGEEPVMAHLAGVVRNEDTGLPVSEVLIALSPGDFTVHSLDILGTFLINNIPPGSYVLTAVKEGYLPYEREIILGEGEIESVDIVLTPEAVVVEPVEGEPVPVEGEAVSVEGEAVPVEGEAVPVEGEAVPVEGEAVPVEGEPVPIEGEAVPVEGEAVPVEGEVVPVEGEAVPVEGEAVPVEGEAVPVEGEAVPDNGPKGTLWGVVRNATTELPVQNATLTLLPGDYQAVSAQVTGLYRIADVPVGPYTLLVQHPAFEDYMTSVDIKQNILGVLLDVVLIMKTGEGETLTNDVEGEAVSAEGETVTPVEGEAVLAEGEAVTPVEGEAVPAEGETATPLEGESVAPAEGETVAVEGEQVLPDEDDDALLPGCNGSQSSSIKSLVDEWFLILLGILGVLLLSVFGRS